MECIEYLKTRLKNFRPNILIVLGSGLSGASSFLIDPVYVPYAEIPGFNVSTAPGHRARFSAGTWNGRNLLIMEGRFHRYEGFSSEDCAAPIKAAHLLGASSMIVTCAAGGINPSYKPGDLVAIEDYINLCCPSPIAGAEYRLHQPRFIDMTHAFDRAYIKKACAVSSGLGYPMERGVYFYMTGPQFETPSEIRAIKNLGGDLVGMSTVPECIMARRCGMRVLGIAFVSNMAAGITGAPISENELWNESNRASSRLSVFLQKYIGDEE